MDKQTIISGLKAVGGGIAALGAAIAMVSQVVDVHTAWGMYVTAAGILIHGASTSINELLGLLGVTDATPVSKP